MSGYVLAHEADDAERQRMALLRAFHGPLTLTRLAAADIRAGWRCLEVGAGSGGMTAWLARRVAPTGRVVAVDLETHWLEPLRSEIVEVRQADITTIELPSASFDLALAQMLLLHVPDPQQTCRQLLAAVVAGGHLIVHDADFTPVALQDASELEAAGIAAMASTMRAGGVHMALGPGLAELLRTAGAQVAHVESQPARERGGGPSALIAAITLERFREKAVAAGTDDTAITAAIAALRDPQRIFIGPTRWVVHARAPS